MTAIRPGRRNTISMNSDTSAKAMQPARNIASSEESPSEGLMELKFVVESLNGSAPALIFAASAEASCAVKLPVMVHFPSVMTASTLGAEIITSSIQMEIVWPFRRSVASANFFAPSPLSSSATR